MAPVARGISKLSRLQMGKIGVHIYDHSPEAFSKGNSRYMLTPVTMPKTTIAGKLDGDFPQEWVISGDACLRIKLPCGWNANKVSAQCRLTHGR